MTAAEPPSSARHTTSQPPWCNQRERDQHVSTDGPSFVIIKLQSSIPSEVRKVFPPPSDLDAGLEFVRSTADVTGLNPTGITSVIQGMPSILWLEAITSRTALEEHAYAKWGSEIRY